MCFCVCVFFGVLCPQTYVLEESVFFMHVFGEKSWQRLLVSKFFIFSMIFHQAIVGFHALINIIGLNFLDGLFFFSTAKVE